MTFPENWINSLFARLQVRYGSSWTRMWDGLDLQAVRADWAEALDGFERLPESIKYGLANLPTDWPPTVDQFREICRRAPAVEAPALPMPEIDPKVALAVLAAIQRPSDVHPKAWAWRLKDREERGEKLSQFQRDCWRKEIGETVAEAA